MSKQVLLSFFLLKVDFLLFVNTKNKRRTYYVLYVKKSNSWLFFIYFFIIDVLFVSLFWLKLSSNQRVLNLICRVKLWQKKHIYWKGLRENSALCAYLKFILKLFLFKRGRWFKCYCKVKGVNHKWVNFAWRWSSIGSVFYQRGYPV